MINLNTFIVKILFITCFFYSCNKKICNNNMLSNTKTDSTDQESSKENGENENLLSKKETPKIESSNKNKSLDLVEEDKEEEKEGKYSNDNIDQSASLKRLRLSHQKSGLLIKEFIENSEVDIQVPNQAEIEQRKELDDYQWFINHHNSLKYLVEDGGTLTDKQKIRMLVFVILSKDYSNDVQALLNLNPSLEDFYGKERYNRILRYISLTKKLDETIISKSLDTKEMQIILISTVISFVELHIDMKALNEERKLGMKGNKLAKEEEPQNPQSGCCVCL